MRFSLLVEIQIDSPTPVKERGAILDAVDQAVLADELGITASGPSSTMPDRVFALLRP